MVWDAQLGNDGAGLIAEFGHKSAERIELDNLFITPRIGGSAIEAINNMRLAAIHGLDNFVTRDDIL